MAYALFIGGCFVVLLPEVKLAWLFYANLALWYIWPKLACTLPVLKLDLEHKGLLWAYSGFLGACLLVVITGKKLWILYASLIIPWSWRYLPELWNTVATSWLFRALLVYLVFLLASLFWSPTLEPKATLAMLASAITVAHFLLLTAGLSICHPQAFERYLVRLSLLAAFTACLVILVWYRDHPFPQSRMEGFGYLDNPIQGAAVFGLFAPVVWWRILHAPSFAERLGCGLALAAILAYACLSWTRSVLLAIGAAFAFLTLLPLNRPKLWALAILGSAGLVALVLVPELTAKLLRPEPYRPYIWKDALIHALKHPWLGQGYFADPKGVTRLADGSLYPYAHSHSFFIANLQIGGVIGLSLSVWIVGYSLYQSYRSSIRTGNSLPLALLVYGFLCIAPNGWQLLPGVKIKAVWLIFWLPLGLAIGAEIKARPTSPASCAARDSASGTKTRSVFPPYP